MTVLDEHAHPALAVDCVVFGLTDERLSVLLIERDLAPLGAALPGGFVRMHESVEDAAWRELVEETGVTPDHLEQLYTFGAVDRDPRGRVVSVGWMGLVREAAHQPVGGTDARAAQWVSLDALPELLFDHAEIVRVALDRLRAKVRYQPIGFTLLPEQFTLGRLQRLYELLVGRGMDKRNFRRKILASGLLEPLDVYEDGVSHRRGRLYRFDPVAYAALQEAGVDFGL